jgi:hypothetical protein
MGKIQSHIPATHRLLKEEALYIRNLGIGLSEPDIRLLNHFFQSDLIQNNTYPNGSPVPWLTIQKDLKGAVSFRLKALVNIGQRWRSHCRQYRVKEEYLDGYVAISAGMSAEQFLIEPKVIFETMRLASGPPQSSIQDSSGHPLPPVIRAAIEILTRNGSYCNLPEIDKHVQQRKMEMLSKMGLDDCRSAKGRYYNDASCRKAFLYFNPERHCGDLWRYRPAWYAVSTGRLHVTGGCLQSASGAMKRAAYSGLPGFKNFDVKSSQVFIAIELLRRANLDPSWLIDYIETPNHKEVYGKAAGIPGSLFKRIVLAICMGAHLPRKTSNHAYRDNSILNYLSEIAEDEEHLSQLLAQLWEVIGPLSGVLKEWHSYLLDVYVPKFRIKGGYLPNALGKHLALHKLKLHDPRQKWVDVSRVAAHLLQGLEGACIQEMIGRSNEAGFTPISCEHDGFIISSGEPDLTMWDDITQRYGLKGMELVEKPL